MAKDLYDETSSQPNNKQEVLYKEFNEDSSQVKNQFVYKDIESNVYLVHDYECDEREQRVYSIGAENPASHAIQAVAPEHCQLLAIEAQHRGIATFNNNFTRERSNRSLNRPYKNRNISQYTSNYINDSVLKSQFAYYP